MTNPKVELKLELTQLEGFGVGIFLRSVILERWVILTTYRPKGQVDGRGGEIWPLTFYWPPKLKKCYVISTISIIKIQCVWPPKLVINWLKSVQKCDQYKMTNFSSNCNYSKLIPILLQLNKFDNHPTV